MWSETLWPWISKTAAPAIGEAFLAWWDNLEMHPGLHIASMAIGAIAVTVIKF